MKLTSASKVLLSMGVVENGGSLASASRALDLSFPVLESQLETTFGEEHVVDYFDTTRSDLILRLKNRFIDRDTIRVRVSTDGLQLTAPADGELLAPSEYSLDADKGIIKLRHAPRAGKSLLSVAYDSGLRLSDDETYLEAPAWLEECAVAVAVHVQNVFVSSPANRKDKAVISIANEIHRMVSQVVNPHKRDRMTVITPSLSVVDE